MEFLETQYISVTGERARHLTSDVAKRFFGAWRYVGRRSTASPPGRVHPGICYDPSGHMVVQVRARPGGPCGQRGPRREEAQAALAEYIAYFGTYTVDERAAR